ncbi:MAG: ABC transporter substrate-binding protein [Roseinatronobacter sp.]
MSFASLTRRGFGVVTAALLASSALVAPLAAQTPPGVIVVGQVAEPQALDPHAVTAVNDFRILVNLFDGLVRFAPGTLEVEPALATSWEISADGLTYTFRLREGVRFHDGSAFDAEAVVWNFDRMLNEAHPLHAATGPFPLSFFFSALAQVEALDPLTVRFTLNAPFAPFLSNLAYPTGLIVSPAAVEAQGADFGRNPSGTGAFMFQDWRSNERVTLVRNPDHWEGPAEAEAVIFRPITDANTRTAEMLAGGIDIMVEVPPVALSQFRGPGFEIVEQAGPHVWFLILNTKEGPFSDLRVRQAANYAINREALVTDVLEGTATVATGPIAPAFAWAYAGLDPYPYDPERARELLAEAGAEGAEITFFVTEGGSGMLDPIPMGTAIQADLARVGFDVRIQTFEWNTFLGRVNPGLSGQADMAQMAWMTNDPDTLPFLTLRTEAWPEAGGFNSGYFSNAQVDALLEAARVETDQDERARLYREMQEIVREEAPWVFVANWVQNAVTSDRVENFRLEPSFFLLLRDVVKN